METTAHLRNYRQSPRKVRLVADLMRGKSVGEALRELDVTVKRATHPVRKLLLSAVANAEHNHKLSKDALYVKSIAVNDGYILKRMRPRARGSSAPIHKHTSHVSLTLSERNVESPKSPKAQKPKKSPSAVVNNQR